MDRRVLIAGLLLIGIACVSMFARVDIAAAAMLGGVLVAILLALPALKGIAFPAKAVELAAAGGSGQIGRLPPFWVQPASIYDPKLGFAAIFLLGGAISGAASGIGVFVLDEQLDRFNWSPPIAFSIALVVLLASVRRHFSPAYSLAVTIAVFIAWAAAHRTAVYLDRNIGDSIELILIFSGMLGAALLAIPFAYALATPAGARPAIALIIAGGLGVVPLVFRILLDDMGVAATDASTGLFVLFVCWQGLVAAAMGYFMRPQFEAETAAVGSAS
jgi:hypothetical protein